MNKRIVSLIMAFVLIYNFTGCQKKEKNFNETLRVGVVTYTQDDPFINAMTQELKDNLKSMENDNFRIIVSEKNGDDSQRDQDEVVEEMIDAGCDIMCVNLVDRTAPGKIIKLARQNNIPIIFFNREPVEEDLMRWDKLYYVGGKAKQSGELQGELAANYIKDNKKVDRNNDGKIQYVILEGEMGHQDAIIRTESVVECLKANGIALEKLSYQIANWNRAQAQTRMMQLIGEYKTDIEMVIANSDSMVLGAVDAYEKLGYTESNIPVFFGIDGTKEGLKAVQEGKIAATVYNDKEGQAKAMVKLITAAVTGKGMENITFENKKCVYLPYKKVTKENVSSMIP